MKRKIRIYVVVAVAVPTIWAGGCSYMMFNPPGLDIEPLRLGQVSLEPAQEMERVSAAAMTVYVNDLGYTEASFPDGLVMIYIPAGSFVMGNNALPHASPQHSVSLSGYWIQKTPVTIGMFRAFVNATGFTSNVEQSFHPGSWVYDFDEEGFRPIRGHTWANSFHQVTQRFPDILVTDNHPVVNVSWYDCLAYANWLAESHALQFTLPSEAEWEYAARGTDGRVYPWGNEEPDGTRANYADETFDRYFPNTGQSIVHRGVDDGYAITSPVGSFPAGASPVGALDMAGNVTEWVYDSVHEFSSDDRSDPLSNDTNAKVRMQKAGFWAGSAGRFDVSPDEIEDGHNIRSDARQGDHPASADDHLGCRLAISYTKR